jgi:hypothetical protein
MTTCHRLPPARQWGFWNEAKRLRGSVHFPHGNGGNTCSLYDRSMDLSIQGRGGADRAQAARVSARSVFPATCPLRVCVFSLMNDRVVSTPHTSGHDDDDRCTAFSDKPPTQRSRKVVASLGGAPNDEQIGVVGVGNPQELSGCVPLGMDERDVDTVVMTVGADLIAQSLCLIGHRLLNGPVGIDYSGKGGRRCAGGARGRTHEDGDSPSTKAPRLATGPAEGIPGRIGPVDPDHDPCVDGLARTVVHVVSAVVQSLAVFHDHGWY